IDRKLGTGLRPRGEAPAPDEERRKLERLVDDALRLRPRGEGSVPPSTFLDLAYRLSRFEADDPWARLTQLVRRFKGWLREKIQGATRSTALRRLWICFDLGLTTVLGLIADGLAGGANDWTALDDLDVQAWLDKHGAAPETWGSG